MSNKTKVFIENVLFEVEMLLWLVINLPVLFLMVWNHPIVVSSGGVHFIMSPVSLWLVVLLLPGMILSVWRLYLK